jgi:hypothetical protein
MYFSTSRKPIVSASLIRSRTVGFGRGWRRMKGEEGDRSDDFCKRLAHGKENEKVNEKVGN